MSKKRVMFISSTGGHLTELLQLDLLFDRYDFSVITEKTKSNLYLKDKFDDKCSFLIYGTKKNIVTYPFKFIINTIKSLMLYFKYRPDYIVTTGVHTAVPMCFIGKMFGSKIVYIETFANIVSKTVTGRILYHIADKFVVQWESMKKLYPDAEYWGWIF